MADTRQDVCEQTRTAKRAARILAAAQAFGQANMSIIVASAGLAGYYLAEDKSLATLPVTTSVIGVALTTIPAAMLMKRLGRKLGFLFGALLGLLGGLIAGYAVLIESFWLLCLGTLLAGSNSAFVAYYRFAAADAATDAFRPKAISWVMIGGVFAGILGPQVIIFSKDLFDPIQFAGAFFGQAVLAFLQIMALLFLVVPELKGERAKAAGRPLSAILAQPRFIVAVLCGIASYALMSLVMTATPLAMVACGFDQSDATLAIQWHVLAMYLPSFYTGNLIQKFGKERVVIAGLIMLAVCGIVALSGITLAHFWIALILLGVGWNFGFIGATAMVTDCYRPEEKNKVQAANDFLVFGSMTIASFSSGKLLNAFGWDSVNLMLFPFLLICFVALFMLIRQEKLAAARATS